MLKTTFNLQFNINILRGERTFYEISDKNLVRKRSYFLLISSTFTKPSCTNKKIRNLLEEIHKCKFVPMLLS